MSPESVSNVLENQEWLALLIALAAVTLSPLVQWVVSNRQLKATIRSTNRQIWIDSFRDELSKYISLTGKFTHMYVKSSRSKEKWDIDQAGHFERRELLERMRLRLNPDETRHQEFEKALQKLHNATDSVKELSAARDDVIEKAREIFKEEWKRVKKGK